MIHSSEEQEILSLLNPAAMLLHSGSDDRRYDPVSGEVLPQYRVSHREYSPPATKKNNQAAAPPKTLGGTFEFFTVAPTRESYSGPAQRTVREAVEPKTLRQIKIYESVKSILEL